VSIGFKRSDETRARIAEAARRRWAATPKESRDAQARLMNEARRLKAIEEAQPQMLVDPADVHFYLREEWTVHIAQPVPRKDVLNRQEYKL